MTRHYDDELAALLALDALEPEEQADAELALGTFPLMDVVAVLAEGVVHDPPPDLRGTVLDAARVRRAPGRPVAGAGRSRPEDALDRTIADFRALLDSLAEAEWNLPAHADHGTVRQLVAHLIGVERLSARWLNGEDVPPLPDHIASTQAVVTELAGIAPARLADLWHDAALAMAAAARRGDRRRLVVWHDVTTTVDGIRITRTFELWAHGMDITAAVGRPLLRLDDERMAAMSAALMVAVPRALAYRAQSAPGRTARFVLTGAAGGVYTVPLAVESTAGEPDFVLVADTVDICRVAARRLAPADLAASVEGDRALAELVLAGLDAFARD